MILQEILELLRAPMLDKAIYPDRGGSMRVGKLPHVGGHAYLHVIFPPRPDEEISDLLVASGLDVPQSVLSFLREINGAILFQGALSLYGLRGEISRDPELRKPFDLIEANTLMRPKGASAGDFFIGGYNEDASRVYLKADGTKVYRRDRKSVGDLAQWPSLENFILNEISRLSLLFDSDGMRNGDASTLPPSLQ
jgi:hypothetical protein